MDQERITKLETLARDTHALLSYLGKNAGSSADWPVRIMCDGAALKHLADKLNTVSKDLKELGYDQTNPELAP